MKKTKLILLQLFIAFVLISTSVYATVNTTIALSINETTAFRGDTVEVTVSLEDVEQDKKIQSVTGYINYDESVIEAITVDNIIKSNDNKVTIGNEILKVEDLTNADIDEIPTTTAYIAFNGNPTTENDSRIVIDFENGITEDTDLLTIRFKVKETATIGEVEKAISYSMFVITEGSEESEEITKDVKLTVKSVENDDDIGNNTTYENENTNTAENKAENEVSNTNNAGNTNANKNTNKVENTNKAGNSNTNKAGNTNTNKNTNKAGNTNTNKSANTNKNVNNNNKADNTVSNVKIPAAGAKALLIPAIMLIILAYVSYNRYMKYKNI